MHVLSFNHFFLSLCHTWRWKCCCGWMWRCTEWDRHRHRRVHLNEHWYNYQWEGHSLFYLEHILFYPPRNKTECVLRWFCSLTQEGVFPGLIPILNSYLENMEVDVDTRCTILNYLKLIKKRASGMSDIFGQWLSWHFSTFSWIRLMGAVDVSLAVESLSKGLECALWLKSCPVYFWFLMFSDSF